MLFIIITLLCGALVKYKYPSYSPLTMFTLGILIFYINKIDGEELNTSIDSWRNINSQIIFRYLIPPLIYNSATHINFHILRQYIRQILLLIIPLLIINIIFMGFLVSFMDDFTWQVCFLFGTIISATDPVSILSILEHMNMSEKVKTLIDGEALLNDAIVYLIFTLLLDNDFKAIPKIVYIPLGSIVLGSVAFLLLFQILRKIYESDIEIILTIIFCHGTFYIAEIVGLSGIFATVIVGLWMSYIGRTAISPSVKKSLEDVWQTFDINVNHLIFALSGLIGTRTLAFIPEHWYKIGILYFGTNFIRCLSILLFKSILRHKKYKIETKQLVLVGLSNIKGSITITLALQLIELQLDDKELILFYTFATTFLTLLINPILVKCYIKYVIKHEYNEALEYLLRIRDNIYIAGAEIKQKLKNETDYLHNINWDEVDQYMIQNEEVDETHIELEPVNDINIEYRIVYLTSLKRSFWQLFDDHLLYRDTIIALLDIVDNVLDTDDKHWVSCFTKYCKFPSHCSWLPEWYKKRILYHDINHRHNLLMGYVLGHHLTLEHLIAVLDIESDIIKELKKEEEESIEEAKKFLIQIEEKYPEITQKIETRQAIYHILKKQQRYLKQIFKEGKINYYIYNHINQEIKETLYEKIKMYGMPSI